MDKQRIGQEFPTKAVLVDLDGTLVDVDPIRHLVQGKKRDFEAFHRASVDCLPNFQVLQRVKNHANNGFSIVILSGRESRFQRLTEFWLAMWDVPCSTLALRPTGDPRKDVILKNELFENLKEDFQFLEAIDDTDDLLRLWERKRIPTVIDARSLNQA